jgi:glycosyltransferase involved in cell wall biosynthesis
MARNRALECAQGDLVAFIDDDESAPAGWLAALLAAMEQHRADVVLGPVNGRLPEDAPEWIRQGRFFERPARASGTRVTLGGTGNALMRASLVRGRRAFDARYGLSGSEDTDFFFRLWRGGACMVWCQEAMLTEAVPPERLSARWLLERGFAAGQGYADIVDRPRSSLRVVIWCAKRGGLVVAAGLLTLAWLPFSKAQTVRYAIKAASNLGQLSTILPFRHEAYRGWGG